ncbi:VWA domain-containing protein [Marinomonas communis]|uniref:Uncharacterized protein with von Willebrand factor type A (VWA) domain n=1 Tax=Marinomonas communis TaxID=28254 RepID=A0A4R6X750_9GAMM|nr:VWA domain-containing protein [Marinomonas communis]TDR05897.1 uncharacterized protein with von Willebrand factor type A (vWA) domain [Marinomonas communis]
MQIDHVELSVKNIKEDINEKYGYLLDSSSILKEKVEERCDQWREDANNSLIKNFPYYESQNRLSKWSSNSEERDITKEKFKCAIDEFHQMCHQSRSPVDKDFWYKQLEIDDQIAGESSNNPYKIGCRLLSREWQKVIDKARNDWEFEQLYHYRNSLLKELMDLLKVLQQLKPVADSLGLDPGLLVDLSKGSLTAQDLKQFKRWAQYLSEDKGLKSLCELLGKIRQIEFSEKIERVQIAQNIEVLQPDINSREEIVGVRMGRDLENVLPSEKALLADVQTSILFDLKYVESRLMCFDMNGMQTIQEEKQIEQDQLIKEEEKKGPMIICVDTSGSMMGMPETIAKAVSLFIANKARNDKRSCYLINFSTGINTLDLSGEIGISSIIDFLSMSFHGGTDAAPALDHALHIMKKDEYKKADLLVISDFIMAGLPNVVLKKIEAQRKSGSRFYSLIIDQAYMNLRQKSLFDQEWIYDPQKSTVHELINFQSKM